MAPDLIRLFAEDDGVVPFTTRGKEQLVLRAKQADDLRNTNAMRLLMTELYGNRPGYGQTESDIFPNPAEQRYGRDFYSDTVPQMGRNVLHYGAEQRKVVNTAEHLELSFLAGMPGDDESEIAAEVVRAAWDWNDERDIATRLMAAMFEYGFRGAELIYDVITRGVAQNVIAPVAIIPRPETWFGFDVRGRARFKPNGRNYPEQFLREYPLVPELKVMFGRSGDLHTRYGIGTAEWCYPTVYEIDVEMKKRRQLTERAGYLPMIVTTPFLEGTADYQALKVQISLQWKNFVLVTGDTPDGRNTYQLGGAEGTNAYASVGNMILSIIGKKENWISSFLQGSIPSAPASGAYNKEVSIDDQKMYQAPSWAACKEAMLNRGFIRPIMLINFPTLEREKWPRASIDASFGEDLRLFMDLVKDLVGMGMPISWVTVSERTSIPIADDGEPLLSAPRAAIAAPADPMSEDDSVKAFSEQTVRIRLKSGQFREVPLDTKILTQNGVVRAANLKGDGSEIMLADPQRYPALVR